MTHAYVHRAIGGDLLGFQPEGRHLLLHLVSQGVQLLLLGLDGGVIRLILLPQGSQFRMLDHYLLTQNRRFLGMHLFLEFENLVRLVRGQTHHPGALAHALTHGLSLNGGGQTQTQRQGQEWAQAHAHVECRLNMSNSPVISKN